ncbi:MAG: hypothetical protein EON95_04065 [Caulobacteraceae bacterium]|nr:MAG: hypothetical protein EON95_04065 [Caulobacteraceae bacterium]
MTRPAEGDEAPRSFGHILMDAGGPAEVARRLGIKRSSVLNWRARDQIEVDFWKGVVKAGIATRAELETAEAIRAGADGSRRLNEEMITGFGTRPLADLLGIKVDLVQEWRRRDVIPKPYWETLTAAGWLTRQQLLEAAENRAALRTRRPAVQPARVAVEAPVRRRHRAGRERLSIFCKVIDVPGVGPGLRLGAHHRLWLEKLEAVERGEIKRLMGFMPPGSAKSTYGVDVFTPWFLARQANRSVLVVTYATALAGRRGRKARNVTRQPGFAKVFGVAPERGRASVIDWGLDNGSEWMGAGMLAGITGNRADLIVIDDPVKGRAEADSDLIRKRTREEFDDTVRTRLKSGGRIVLVQTRWHEDDLAGSLLPTDYDGQSGPVLCRDGEVWEVVNIPAQAEREDDPLRRKVGDYLWPEYWNADHWPQFKLNVRTWNALYQQRPRPVEGAYFERGWFKRFQEHELPRHLRYYGTSDYAVTEGGGDYTRLLVWGVDAEFNLWRVASWGGQTSSDQWIERQCDLIADFRRRGGIRRWFGEAGVIQRAVEPMLRAKMKARSVSCPLEWLSSGQDKATRARSAQSLVREGRIFVRDDGDGDCFIDECAGFPFGRHDDEVDCLSLIGRSIDRLSAPVASWRKLPEYAESYDPFDPPIDRGFGPQEYAGGYDPFDY